VNVRETAIKAGKEPNAAGNDTDRHAPSANDISVEEQSISPSGKKPEVGFVSDAAGATPSAVQSIVTLPDRVLREKETDRAGVSQPVPAFIFCQNNKFEFSIAFDPDKRNIGAFSFTVDESKIVALQPDATALPAVRFFNMVANSDFSSVDEIPWRVTMDDESSGKLGVNFDKMTTLEGAGTGFVCIKSEDASALIEYVGDDEAPRHFEVVGDIDYILSGYFGTHRCAGRMVVSFYDEQKHLLENWEAAISAEIPGGTKIGSYERTFVRAPAPAAARTATLAFHVQRRSKVKDAFFFLTRLWFGRCATSELADWESAPTTQTGFPTGLSRGYAYLTLQIPLECHDGRRHELRVVDRETGLDVEGSPLEFRRPAMVSGEITEITGDRVVGLITVAGDLKTGPSIELRIDGERVSVGKLMDPGQVQRIELAIPSRYCDGRPHLFTLSVAETGQTLAHRPDLSPTLLTPFDTLQTYAGMPIDAALAPAARTRYRALLDQLRASDGRSDGTKLGILHDNLLLGPLKRSRYERLAFSCNGHPRVSIVIPVRDKFEMSYFCLSALGLAYNETSFEIIVVDDGSTDETLNIANLISGIKVVRIENSGGFVRACNLGAREAEGEFIVFLNNDTEPTSRWLDELVYAFDQFEGVGLAGSKLLYPNGTLQEAGGIVWSNGNPWNYGRNQNSAAPQFSYTRQVDYVSGAALMVPRQVWQDVGGFSDEFVPAYFEDTDLAFKIRERGLKTVYVPLSVVYHFEGVSAGTSPASGMKRFQEVNRPKFKRKWSNACSNKGREGEKVDINKDRGIRFRALMLDFETPRIDFDAGSYAAIQEIRALQALGFKVTYLPTNFAHLGRHTETLQRLGVESLYAPFANSVETFMEERGREFDLVYITRYKVAEQVLSSIRRHAPNAKVALNLADLHFLRELRAGMAAQDRGRIDAAIGTREAELAMIRAVDLVLSYSPVEEAVIVSHWPNGTIAQLPWIAETSPMTAGFAERAGLGFIGGFRHDPNTAAVDFFVDNVMPKLSRTMPDVSFEIYGSAISPESRKRWTRDNVVVVGQVGRLEEMFDHIRVFVAPLSSGAGVKGKVFDSLARGVPAVLSPMAAEGIGLRDGVDVLIAATPDDWAQQIKRLYEDEALWQRLSTAGREVIESRYSFSRGVGMMRAALEKAGLYCEPDPDGLVLRRCMP